MEYLAIVFFSAGSSHGRAETKEEAVKICSETLVQDWGSYFDVKGKEAKVVVYEVGKDRSYYWHGNVVYDDETEEAVPVLEIVKVTL